MITINKEVKKTIIRLLQFFFIFAVISFTTYYLLSLPRDKKGISLGRNIIGNQIASGGWGHSLQRFRDADTQGEADILIIGSSHAYRGFDPRIFERAGLTVMNLGSSSQTPINSYYLLREYIEKAKPRLVIFESYFGVFEDSTGIESSYDISVNKEINKNMVEMALASGNPHAMNNLLFLALERIKWPLASVSQSSDTGDKYIKGYNEVNQNNTPERLSCGSREYSVSKKQLDYFGKSLRLAEDYGASVVAVAHPLPKEKIECVANYGAIIEKIESVAESEGIDFTDYSDEMTLDSYEFFKDNNHLNSDGVVLFNNKFLNDLIKKGYITLAGKIR